MLDAVRQDDLPSLHIIAVGIDRDRDAAIASLTLPRNSGVVEGRRADFGLVRKRLLLARNRAVSL